MAAPLLSRGVGGAIYGVLAFLVLQSSDTISAYLGEIARATAHFASRPKPGSTAMLESKFDELVAAIKDDKTSKSSSILGSIMGTGVGSWTSTLLMLIFPLASLTMRLLNISVWDMLWVSRSKFNQVTESLKDAVGSVANTIGKVRNELLTRIDVVDRTLVETRNEMRTEITALDHRMDETNESIKASEIALSQRVDEVRHAVEQSEERLAGQLDRIEAEGTSTNHNVQRLEATFKESERRLAAHIDRIESGLKTANKGIWLLCGVVADHQAAAATTPKANHLTEGSKGALKELAQFAQQQDFILGGVSLTSTSSSSGVRQTPVEVAAPDASGGINSMRQELLRFGVSMGDVQRDG